MIDKIIKKKHLYWLVLPKGGLRERIKAILSSEEMDVRGRRNPAEVIADAVIRALSNIDANITVPLDGDDLA